MDYLQTWMILLVFGVPLWLIAHELEQIAKALKGDKK